MGSTAEKIPFAGDTLSRYAKDLVDEGLTTQDQLILAKASEENLGIDLGHILISRGFVGEKDLLEFIAKKLKIPYYEPKDSDIDEETIKKFPFHLAKKHVLLPLCQDRRNPELKKTLILMANPTNAEAKEELNTYYPDGVEVLLGAPQKIIEMLGKHHKDSTGPSEPGASSIGMLELAYDSSEEVQTEMETKQIQKMASGAKIISAVNNIIVGAKKNDASDIHIEPYRQLIRIRYRIDGMLQEMGTLPRNMHMPMVSRIKIMAGLNIAERRIPQDGKTRVILTGQPVDIRISSLPTQFGEKVVMRILSKDNVNTVEALGFSNETRSSFSEIINKPNGIFLVTGPTGSGKSSTLYAGLMRINSPDINIMTIEDPVESELDGVNQISVSASSGLTFASVLRSALRQDPDVIMLGEIRDGETAEIAVRAAITGHMVLSTLHTNSAPGAVDRLKDLGLEPFMLASSLKGVLAQRLVRRICEGCKEEVPAENDFDIAIKKAFEGKGCEDCNNTGYSGRIGIFELLAINKDVKELIHQGKGEDDLKNYMAKNGIKSMLEDGIEKIEKGITTIEEILRVTVEDE